MVRVATAPLWGHAVDRLGARPVLVLCSFGIAAVPALWLFIAPDFLWPLAVEAAAAGALWAGHGIASMDLTLNSAPADRRPYYVAVFGATSGVGFGAASVVIFPRRTRSSIACSRVCIPRLVFVCMTE